MRFEKKPRFARGFFFACGNRIAQPVCVAHGHASPAGCVRRVRSMCPRHNPQRSTRSHLAVVAVGELERQRAPRRLRHVRRIEVRDPAAAFGLQRGDGRGIAIDRADIAEPRLLRAVGREREPPREHAVVGQHFEEEAVAALLRVVPRAGEAGCDRHVGGRRRCPRRRGSTPRMPIAACGSQR